MQTNKRIGIDVRMYNSSGIGRYIRNIVIRLVKERPQWDFFLLGYKCDFVKNELLNFSNVRIIFCNSHIYGIGEQWELYKKIPLNLDCFWSPHWNIPLLYRGNLLVSIHDMFHLAHTEYIGAFYKVWYAKLMFKLISKKANEVITVSNFSKREIARFTSIDIDNINVIYNGIDDKWFRIKKGEKIYPRNYILYVGNVKPHKNLVRLVKAFKSIKDDIDCDLVIVGKRDGFVTADNEIKKLVTELEHRVKFTGYINDYALEQYYAQANMFVFPSLYEGFGLPPLEAMAAGCKRVLCSNIACIKEVCGNNVNYFNPLDIDDMAQKMRETFMSKPSILNYNWRNKYKWENSVSSIENIIENIIYS